MWLRKRAPARSDADAHDTSADHVASKTRRLLRRFTPLGDEPPTHVKSEDLLEGKMLRTFAKSVVHKGVISCGRPSLQGDFKLASLCSGSEVLSVAMGALSSAFQEQGIELRVFVPLACEIEPNKRQWIQKVQDELHPMFSEGMCVFDDITCLSSGKAWCQRHSEYCAVKEQFDGLMCGFSCRDLSRMNPNRAKLASLVFSSSASPGKTNDTFTGALEFIGEHNPEFIGLENSDTLDDADHAIGLDILLQNLAEMGYDVQAFLIDCQEYALPQARKRVFVVGVKRPARRLKIANFSAFFNKYKGLLESFKMEGPDLRHVLLGEDNEFVRKELLAKLSKGMPKGWDSSTIDAHRREWSRSGMRWQACKASKNDKDSPWFGTLAARKKDTLAFNQHTNKKQPFRLIGCDIGQSIARASTTVLNAKGQVISPTLLPGSCLWLSIEEDVNIPHAVHRPLLGVEALTLQGWPILDPRWLNLAQSVDNSFHLDLAGNAFPGTVIIALIASLVFAIDWDTDVKQSQWDDEVFTDNQAAGAAACLLQRVGSTKPA